MEIPSESSEEFRIAYKFVSTIGKDLDEAWSLLSEDLVAEVFPESLGITSPRTKEEWKDQWRVLSMIEWKVTILDFVEGFPGKVWFRLKIESTLRSGSHLNTECMYLLRLARDSEGVLKIVQTAEFHDSRDMSEFMLQEAKKSLRAK